MFRITRYQCIFAVDYSLTKGLFFQSPDGRDGCLSRTGTYAEVTDRIRYTSQNNLTFQNFRQAFCQCGHGFRGDEV